MATAQEEQEPPSPSVFLNLQSPSTPRGDGDPSSQPHDDLTLDYIARMLMEEDIVDKFLYQYPDHLALLQAQQPFAQILSTSSDAQQLPAPVSALLPGQGVNTDSTTHQQVEGEPNMHMLSGMAFFKGVEEASGFLPRENGTTTDGRGRKNRSHGDGETEADVGRRSKQMALLEQPESEEEAAARKMLDNLMINGYQVRRTEMQEVRVAVERENKAGQQQIICRKLPRGRLGTRPAVVDLHKLLIRCAEAVATNDQRSAGELLARIKRHSSPTGDATQRLAYYFAEGLEARLAGTGSQLYRSLMTKRTSLVVLLKAYQLHMATCCFLKVAFLFSNKTIYNAVTGKKKLHIVHYGASDGFEWPELLRWLANREDGPPEVRITGINSPQPGFRPTERAEEAGRRLSQCAGQLGVPFKFRAIAAKPEAVRAEDLDVDPDEVLVVNCLFHFRTLMDESVIVDRLNPRDLVLSTIREMRPSVFVHAIVNGSYNTAFFMTRFREALYNYTAQFDAMEATVARDSDERLLVEQDILARCAMNIIACEGTDRVERAQNYRQWQARNQRAGLRQLPLDPDIVQLLRDQVKQQYHKHFLIDEDHRWLLQGWKGRVLYALSTWAADDASSSELAYIEKI